MRPMPSYPQGNQVYGAADAIIPPGKPGLCILVQPIQHIGCTTQATYAGLGRDASSISLTHTGHRAHDSDQVICGGRAAAEGENEDNEGCVVIKGYWVYIFKPYRT